MRPAAFFGPPALALRKAAHGALAKVTEDIEKLRFNVCLAYIREFAHALGRTGLALVRGARSGARTSPGRCARPPIILVQLFHPMMPHLAEECWAALGHAALIAVEAWPQVERELAGRRHASRWWCRSTARNGPT